MSVPEPVEERVERFAREPLDGSDLALLNSLRALYDERDPVPDGLAARIEFRLTLDALEAEVATLTQIDLAAAGARTATEAVRTVTFTSESLTTMVTITPQDGGTVRVDGWAAPGAGVRVELLPVDAARQETTADEDGRFVFARVPSGLAKFALYVATADGTTATVVSPTVEL
ncbi:hypothetical protein [uncultured Friedmanniella sp.]|uniref:hypothetical protein n=1 Tax=uncultured Friedmanniella sp. TaxID=335381 RepID=UPI0035CA45F5